MNIANILTIALTTWASDQDPLQLVFRSFIIEGQNCSSTKGKLWALLRLCITEEDPNSWGSMWKYRPSRAPICQLFQISTSRQGKWKTQERLSSSTYDLYVWIRFQNRNIYNYRIVNSEFQLLDDFFIFFFFFSSKAGSYSGLSLILSKQYHHISWLKYTPKLT